MSDRQNLRVALLEDDSEQAVRVSGWIVNKGYHCDVFEGAEAFQRAFRKSSYDVVLLDWTLQSGSSGLEVLHWVRRTLTSDIPVIFVTARQDEQDIVLALQAGADDYLAKPVRQHELLARLFALVRRAQPETEILECPPYVFDIPATGRYRSTARTSSSPKRNTNWRCSCSATGGGCSRGSAC